MVNPEMQHLIPIQLYGKSDILFGNLEQIYLFHNDVFLRDLENCIETTELIGLCFVQRVSEIATLYLLNIVLCKMKMLFSCITMEHIIHP